MATKVRERLQPAARRAQLLEVGAWVFTQRAYDDFTMEELADLAGVSKGLLYHYFPTKREFYIAALRDAVDEMLHLTAPAVTGGPQQTLRQGLDAYLGYVEAHAPAYRAVLQGGIGADPEVRDVAEQFRDAISDRLQIGAGLRSPSPEQRIAIRGWIGMVEAASLDWIDHRDLPRGRLIDLLSSVFATALAAAA